MPENISGIAMFCCGIILLVVIAGWLYNRRYIQSYRTAQSLRRTDPRMYNRILSTMDPDKADAVERAMRTDDEYRAQAKQEVLDEYGRNPAETIRALEQVYKKYEVMSSHTPSEMQQLRGLIEELKSEGSTDTGSKPEHSSN